MIDIAMDDLRVFLPEAAGFYGGIEGQIDRVLAGQDPAEEIRVWKASESDKSSFTHEIVRKHMLN